MKHYSNLKFIEASPLFKGLCQRQVWEADFWVRQDPKLDKRALLAALRDGPVAGAALSNGGSTVSIRSK